MFDIGAIVFVELIEGFTRVCCSVRGYSFEKCVLRRWESKTLK